jgi:SagB-type dehydrogenase family enzyme
MEIPERNIGQRFQQETKYLRPSCPPKKLSKTPEPSYPGTHPLPPPPIDAGPSLWKVLVKRRSIRDYTGEPLSQTDLSTLLWSIQGVTAPASSPWYRTAPSAGALHPIDTYMAVHRVEGLKPGIYSLNVADFALQMKKEGDFADQIAEAALGQEPVRAAAVVFIWVAVIRRSRQKYHERAYRYIYLDCGHLCQNLYLAATAMNLGCCGIGAFFDEEVNEAVGVDGWEETAIYLATVGRKRGGQVESRIWR